MGLAERENKRKQSIVGTMIADLPENQDNKKISPENINIIPKCKTETRSKRINLLIPPSVYAEVQKKCSEMDISLNECINQFLFNWVHM